MKKSLILIAIFATTFLGAELPYTVLGLSKDNHISGPELTEADLEGRAVFIDMWGLNCPPCKALLPHMQSVYSKMKKNKKFVMIASHFQGRNDAAITELLKKNGCEFPVYQACGVDGVQTPGYLPYSYLVAPDGKILAQGHPTEVLKKLPDILKTIPDIDPTSIVGSLGIKANKDLVKKLKIGQNVDSVRKVLEQRIAKGGEASAEAKEIQAAIDKWVETQTVVITENIEGSPSKAVEAYEILAKTSPLSAKKIAERVLPLTKNAVTKKLLASRKVLTSIKNVDTSSKNKMKVARDKAAMQIKTLELMKKTEKEAEDEINEIIAEFQKI